MLKVKSGDLDKMGLLYERHKRRLFGFFYNISGDSNLSEDLVQNVFIRMLKYKHTYSGEGSFLAWMFRTARNVKYDHHKKTKALFQADVSTLDYRMVDDDNVVVQLEKKDNLDLLQKALLRLSEEQREVLVFSKLKEMKFSEVGEILGCSEGAAKVKAHRALKALKAIVQKMEIR